MGLFKTTLELRSFYPARLTFDLEDFAPTLEAVEQEHLVEGVLGEAQYVELRNAYDGDTLSAQQEKLLKHCRVAVANLAIYSYTGFANVEFSAGGLVVGSTEHKKPAAEWRTRDLELASLRMGYRGLDVLCGFLEANKADFPTWDDSPAAAHLRTGFLRTTAQLQERVHIGNSGSLFRRMLPVIRRIEGGVVLDTLCSTGYAESLKEKITADTLTIEERAVVALVRNATAHLALSASIVELSLRTDHQGIWTPAAMIGGQTSVGPLPGNDTRLQHRIDHHQRLGQEALVKLQKELQRQAEADPTHAYRNTACYQDPTAEKRSHYGTEGNVGMF
jgi:hypothetical protein